MRRVVKKRNVITLTVVSVLTGRYVQANNYLSIQDYDNKWITTSRQSATNHQSLPNTRRKTLISFHHDDDSSLRQGNRRRVVSAAYDMNSDHDSNSRSIWNQARSLFYNVVGGIQPRIVGGNLAADGEFPSYAFTIGDTLCGGTLIHPDIIMTAAHCEKTSYAQGAFIGGVDIDGTSSEQLNVVQSIPHPNYNPTDRDNDIMLVKLEGMGSTAPLQKLNMNPDIPAGTEVTVIGFGYTFENGDVSDYLLQVQVQVYSDEQCAAYWGNIYKPQLHVCAGTKPGGKDSCQGDSGGPLMTNTNEVQVGIVSFGDGCAKPNTPAIYTRVSTYRSWILQTICRVSDVPPADCGEAKQALVSAQPSALAPSLVTSSYIPSIVPSSVVRNTPVGVAPSPALSPSDHTKLPTSSDILFPPTQGVIRTPVSPASSDVPSNVPGSDAPSMTPTVCQSLKSQKNNGKGNMNMSGGKGMMRMKGKGGKGMGVNGEPSIKTPKGPKEPTLCPDEEKSKKGGKGGMDMGKGGTKKSKGGMGKDSKGKGMRMGKGRKGIIISGKEKDNGAKKKVIGGKEKDKGAKKKKVESTLTPDELIFLQYLESLRSGVDNRMVTKDSSTTSDAAGNFDTTVSLILTGQDPNEHIVEKDVSSSIAAQEPMATTRSAERPLVEDFNVANIKAHERPPKSTNKKKPKIITRTAKRPLVEDLSIANMLAHERPLKETKSNKPKITTRTAKRPPVKDLSIANIITHERPLKSTKAKGELPKVESRSANRPTTKKSSAKGVVSLKDIVAHERPLVVKHDKVATKKEITPQPPPQIEDRSATKSGESVVSIQDIITHERPLVTPPPPPQIEDRSATKSGEEVGSIQDIITHERPLVTPPPPPQIEDRSATKSGDEVLSIQDIITHERPLVTPPPPPQIEDRSATKSGEEVVSIQDIITHERPLVPPPTPPPQIEDRSATKSGEEHDNATLKMIEESAETTKSLTSMKLIGQLIGGHRDRYQ